MTGSTVDIDGVTFQVNFNPNMSAPEYEKHFEMTLEEEPSASASTDEDAVVGDNKKSKKKKKIRLVLSLPSKLKKKLKPKTKKKLKGKSKMASLLSKSAIEPSKALIEKWKAKNGFFKKHDVESSGSLFAGRLEDEDTITKLPTIPESGELKQELPCSDGKKHPLDEAVEEKKSTKKQLKLRLKLFLKKFKKFKSSQSSVADTASTMTSMTPPRNNIGAAADDDDDASIRDDTEVALASIDETFFSIPSETSLHPSDPCDVALPPSLTLVQPPLVAQQVNCAANVVWDGSFSPPYEVECPSDEEDSSLDSIVSPVPSPQHSDGGSPRKKILNYKKPKPAKKITTSTTSNEKTPAVVVTVSKPTRTAVAALSRWNVWALLLAAALCALSVWQKCFDLLPQSVSKSIDDASAASLSSGASISFFLEGESTVDIIATSVTTEDKEDSEWPYDECLLSETPVITATTYSSSWFDETGALDSSYLTFFF